MAYDVRSLWRISNHVPCFDTDVTELDDDLQSTGILEGPEVSHSEAVDEFLKVRIAEQSLCFLSICVDPNEARREFVELHWKWKSNRVGLIRSHLAECP